MISHAENYFIIRQIKENFFENQKTVLDDNDYEQRAIQNHAPYMEGAVAMQGLLVRI